MTYTSGTYDGENFDQLVAQNDTAQILAGNGNAAYDPSIDALSRQTASYDLTLNNPLENYTSSNLYLTPDELSGAIAKAEQTGAPGINITNSAGSTDTIYGYSGAPSAQNFGDFQNPGDGIDAVDEVLEKQNLAKGDPGEVRQMSGGGGGKSIGDILLDVAAGAGSFFVGPELAAAVDAATGIGAIGSAALTGAALGAGDSAITGGNPLTGALTGGLGGAAGSALGQAAPDVADTLGVSTSQANAGLSALGKAGLGATSAALTGGNPALSAASGAAGSVAGAVAGGGASDLTSSDSGNVSGGDNVSGGNDISGTSGANNISGTPGVGNVSGTSGGDFTSGVSLPNVSGVGQTNNVSGTNGANNVPGAANGSNATDQLTKSGISSLVSSFFGSSTPAAPITSPTSGASAGFTDTLSNSAVSLSPATPDVGNSPIDLASIVEALSLADTGAAGSSASRYGGSTGSLSGSTSQKQTTGQGLGQGLGA